MKLETMTLTVLLALTLALPAAAETRTVEAPAAETAAAALPSLADESGAPIEAATGTRPLPGRSPAPASPSKDVSNLEALEWIVQVVTCHDSRTCDTHTRGIALNFSLPY